MNPKYQLLKEHWGHTIEIVYYGQTSDPFEISVECEDCNVVLYSETKEVEEN